MFDEVENYIFYPSTKPANKNIGFSSSTNNLRKRALSFTPNDSRINKPKITENKELDYKSVAEKDKDNYLEFSRTESDSSLTLIEDENKMDENELEEQLNFHRIDKRNSKTQSLALFNKNFEILYNTIAESKSDMNLNEKEKELFFRRPHKSISINMEKLMKKFEKKVLTLNENENINDFYEYTEICFEYISQLQTKPNIKDCQYVKFNFTNEEKDKKIALLDLDETLIHCIGEINEYEINKKKCDKIIEITLPSKKKVKIGVNVRPHLLEAMEIIQEKYTIVIFTASHSSYTDPILKEIDPENKYFKYRLYRNNCIPTKIDGKNFYVKDLDILNKYYDLKDIIIVDNSVLSFAYHINNGIPIIPFYDSKDDSELIILAYYLSYISQDNDLRKSNKKHLKLQTFLQEAEKIIKGEEINEDINNAEILITENNTYIFMNEDNPEKREQFIKLLNHYHNEFAKIAN